MPLTDNAIRKARPEAKQRMFFDERGLFLLISPKGGKWWRFKYLFDGKEKVLSLGTYPDVSLKDARDRRDEARKQVAAGIDPGEHRKARKMAKVAKRANSFEVVAREWYAKHSPNWSANHGDRIIRRLERDIFPWIGGSPVADITAPQLLEVIRRIEQRGALEAAHRALGNCGQVFRYAVATGRAERDPTGDVKGALPPVKGTHFAAVTDPKKVGGVKSKCTSSPYRRVTRWEHEAVIEALEARLDKEPERMRIRRQTAEYPFGTLKAWMGHTHFQMKTLKHVSTVMSLHVLAYNLKRVMNILGTKPLIRAIQA